MMKLLRERRSDVGSYVGRRLGARFCRRAASNVAAPFPRFGKFRSPCRRLSALLKVSADFSFKNSSGMSVQMLQMQNGIKM